MARATRPHQIIRCLLTAFALLCGVINSAHAGRFGGSSYTLEIPKGWNTRPGFASAEILVTSPQNGANLNVVVNPALNGQTLESGAREITSAVKREKNSRIFGNGFTKLGGTRALAVEYAYDSRYNGRLRVRQVLVQRNKQVIVVTCMTKAATWPRVWPAFKAMLASFQWKK